MSTVVETSSQRRPASQPRRRVWLLAGEIVIWSFLIVMALVEFAPISWIFSTSLRNPAESYNLPPDFWPTAFHWENYLAVILSPRSTSCCSFGTA